MKSKKTFKYCEYCNKEWSDVSPPTAEEYENGMIEIRDGTILLPKKVIELNELSGGFDSRSKSLAGIYCNHKCINEHIKKILKIEI